MQEENCQWAVEFMELNNAWKMSGESTHNDPNKIKVRVAVMDFFPTSNDFDRHIDLELSQNGGNIVENDFTRVADLNDNCFHCPHGVEVASVVGATSNNNEGLAGISYNADIYPMSTGSTSFRHAREEIDADVITTSFIGGSITERNLQIHNAIKEERLVIAASGNHSSNPSTVIPASLNYGDSYDLYERIISVTETRLDGNYQEKWTASYNYSPGNNPFSPDSLERTKAFMDLAAPGRQTPVIDKVKTEYRITSGSSFSSPHVAGVSALLVSINPNLTYADYYNILTKSTDQVVLPDTFDIKNDYVQHPDDNRKWNPYTGYGRLNAFKAVYKAMQMRSDELALSLKSLDGDAFAATNSANIIDDESSSIWHHGVFASGNDIYYFRRRPWTTDQITRLSNKDIDYPTVSSEALWKHSHPSITQIEGKLFVVWQVSDYHHGFNVVVYSVSNDGGASWSDLQQVSIKSPIIDPKPALSSIETGSSKLMMVVFNDDNGLRYYTYDFNSDSWDNGGDVPQTYSGDQRPTITANVNIYGQPRIHLAYEAGGAIYYNSFTSANGWSSQSENISSIANGGNYTHKTPVITSPFSGTQRQIAWHRQQGSGSGPYDNVIIHRRGNEWNWFSSFSTVYFQNQELPSISALANGEADLLFQNSGSGDLIYHQRYEDGSFGWGWSAPSLVGGSGSVYPAVSQSGSSNHLLWARYNSTDQAYEIQRLGTIYQQMTDDDEYESVTLAGYDKTNHYDYYSRAIVFTDTSDAFLSVTFHDIQLQSDRDSFYPTFEPVGYDTLDLRLDNVDQVLRLSLQNATERPHSLELTYSVDAFETDKIVDRLQQPRIQLLLADGSISIPFEINDTGSGAAVHTTTIHLQQTLSHQAGFGIRGIRFTDQTDVYVNHIYDYVTLDQDDGGIAESQPHQAEQEKEYVYELGNYPNPYNPTTQISYTLPQRTPVRLTVYDIMGRRVATLVNTVQDAGTHQAMFDASGLASGLYIYRLQTPTMSLTRQMMFVK